LNREWENVIGKGQQKIHGGFHELVTAFYSNQGREQRSLVYQGNHWIFANTFLWLCSNIAARFGRKVLS